MACVLNGLAVTVCTIVVFYPFCAGFNEIDFSLSDFDPSQRRRSPLLFGETADERTLFALSG